MAITEVEVREMIRVEVAKHENLSPHHTPPCSFFKERRETTNWVLGLIGTAFLLVLGYGVSALSQTKQESQDMKIGMAEIKRDINFLVSSVGEMRTDIKAHTSLSGTKTVQ